MTRTDDRGFFTIDAFFALILLVTISGVLLNAFEGREQAANRVSAAQEADMACEKLAAAINTVYANGSNFELRLDLPPEVRGYSYTITVDNHQRAVTAENSDVGITPSVAKAAIVCKSIENVALDFDNLSRTIRVYWLDNQVRVVNA